MRLVFYFLLLIIFSACHRAVFKERWLKKKAPEHFTAGFRTSKGYFEAEFTREWSPLAVDRLYAQVKHHYYDHALFYRVRPAFVAQFGCDDSLKRKPWTKNKIPDEPVLKANERATISFARGGKESRGNDLFINLRNNSPRLDTISPGGVKGYPVLGIVTKNMTVVDSLYSGYGDKVFAKYDTLLKNKRAFLDSFPKLDSIKRVLLIKRKK
ncbi:MAG: peptidylprolyl isomerase [Bacteroidota bacterium]